MTKIQQRCFLAIILLLPATYVSAADNLAPKIKNTAGQKTQAQLKLLKTLVNLNSGSTNPSGVKNVGAVLEPYFHQIGFKTTWSPDIVAKQRAGTLFAEHSVTNKPCILLIGHLDTVFPKNSRFQFYQEKNNVAYGPGVADDKGGIVVILSALQILHELNVLQNLNIKVALVGDEEDSAKPTSISRKPLIDAAKNCEYALDFEPGVSVGTATIARRGVTQWQINTTGVSAHSSAIFHQSIGDGAIFELSRILSSIRARIHHEKYVTFNPSMIAGGTAVQYDAPLSQANASGKQNVIPQSAIAIGDMRYLTINDREHFKKFIRLILRRHLPNTSATITYEDGVPPMPPAAGNLKLLKQFSVVSQELGYGSVSAIDPVVRGAADIAYVASFVPQNLSGLGPIGGGEHTVYESLEIKTLPIATARAALLIYRLGK